MEDIRIGWNLLGGIAHEVNNDQFFKNHFLTGNVVAIRDKVYEDRNNLQRAYQVEVEHALEIDLGHAVIPALEAAAILDPNATIPDLVDELIYDVDFPPPTAQVAQAASKIYKFKELN